MYNIIDIGVKTNANSPETINITPANVTFLLFQTATSAIIVNTKLRMNNTPATVPNFSTVFTTDKIISTSSGLICGSAYNSASNSPIISSSLVISFIIAENAKLKKIPNNVNTALIIPNTFSAVLFMNTPPLFFNNCTKRSKKSFLFYASIFTSLYSSYRSNAVTTYEQIGSIL